MNNVIRVDFHGDALEATQDDTGRVWVVVRRVCENLGIDYSGQRTVLKAKAWARVEMISTLAPDGRNREHLCLDLESLPLWLANIDRVADDLQPKLVKYQLEAKAVLSAHFFGGGRALPEKATEALTDLAHGVKAIGEGVTYLIQKSQEHDKCFEEQSARLECVELRVESLERNTKKRRPPKRATVALSVQFVADKFGGMCPCCGLIRAVSVKGEKIGHWDHYIDNSYPANEAGWLICKPCNDRVRDAKEKVRVRAFFDAYQARLKEYTGPLFQMRRSG